MVLNYFFFLFKPNKQDLGPQRETCQATAMKLFGKIVNGFSITIFAKSFSLDVLQDFEYTFRMNDF